MKRVVQRLKKIEVLEAEIAKLQKLIEAQSKIVEDIPLLKTRLETLEAKAVVKR